MVFIFCSSCLESSAMFDDRHRSGALTVCRSTMHRRTAFTLRSTSISPDSPTPLRKL
ncbi:hypothetical protein HanIR_Chr17g0900621 [Helianthus annuus]|nr:hypothetical protein HanIR_Chr17g0900621 [Helianthus annuus]